MLLATLAGALLGAVFHAASPDPDTSSQSPIIVVDGREIAVRVAATATASDGSSDRYRTSSSALTADGRKALGICVQDTTNTVSTDAIVKGMLPVLGDLLSHPGWAMTAVRSAPPLLATSCPIPSGALTSTTRDSRGRLYGGVGRQVRATPFAAQVFLIADNVVAHDFDNDPPEWRTNGQEILPTGPDSGVVVSYALHVTPTELGNRALMTRVLARALGFAHPTPPPRRSEP
jgi:hypothetical protein